MAVEECRTCSWVVWYAGEVGACKSWMGLAATRRLSVDMAWVLACTRQPLVKLACDGCTMRSMCKWWWCSWGICLLGFSSYSILLLTLVGCSWPFKMDKMCPWVQRSFLFLGGLSFDHSLCWGRFTLIIMEFLAKYDHIKKTVGIIFGLRDYLTDKIDCFNSLFTIYTK